MKNIQNTQLGLFEKLYIEIQLSSFENIKCKFQIYM